MANDLRLQVVLDLVNAASGPLRNITKSSAEAARVLKQTRDTLAKLNEQQRVVNGFNTQQAAMREAANKVRVLRQNLEVLSATEGSTKKEIAAADKALSKATASYEKHRDAVFKLRHQLTNLGITKVSEAQRRLKVDVEAANKALADQQAKFKALNEQRGKLHALNRRHSKEMIEVGMLAGTGVAGQVAGRNIARPVLSAVQTYAQQESASSQLKSAMMLADGSVSAEFGQINELAMRLGDKLPGTTADFIEMMRTLKEQGISAKSILGGTGEAAAYLGVQLKMPVAAAAEFAAQMQDATRTGEKDMMALMDLIQRAKYTGVDSGYMLQGFSKMSPILSTIKQEGVQAANTLAPLLSMMNQSGMTDGGSAGNAIRKVFDATLDAKKLGKANDALAGASAGFQLNFTDKNGNFAGLDNLYAQLEKIKGIQSDVTRKSVMKEMFGDDSETQTVLTIMMNKGKAGYLETVAKLKEQADLRQRVNAELGTINNLWEATTGTFTNVMAAMGATVAPEVKDLTNRLGELASSTRAWIAEHPTLVGWLVKTIAVLAALVFGFGTLALTVASVMGPFFVMRFVMGWLGLKFNLWAAAIRVVGTALTWLRGVLFFLAANPVVLAIAAIVIAIAAAAYLIYKYWGPITAYFRNLWANIKAGFSSMWESFKQFGGMLMDGLIGGITSRLAAIKTAIVNVAESTVGWFKEKLGIRSPSRVFMQSGQFLGEGAAIGIRRSTDMVRKASVGMAAAATIGMAGAGQDLRIDQRQPLQAGQRASIVIQGDTITIPITAAPGTDPQALARAISAELDRRERAKMARIRSALGDVN